MGETSGLRARATVLVYCRVGFGAGHWFRIAALMESLTGCFHVACVVDGAMSADLGVPAGVEIVPLPALAPGDADVFAGV